MITLYEATETTFTGNGLCGLSPVSCVVKEVAGGAYELTMQHPMDDDGKYLLLTEERLIKAPVPKQVIPETVLPELYSWKTNKQTRFYSRIPNIPYNSATWTEYNTIYDDAVAYGTSSEYWWKFSSTPYAKDDRVFFYSEEKQGNAIFKSNRNSNNETPGSEGQQKVYYWWTPEIALAQVQAINNNIDSLTIRTLSANTHVYKVADAGSTAYGAYAQIKTELNETGYVLAADIQIDEGREPQVLPEQTITEQVFRIYSVSCDEESQTYTVNARHISYDFMANSLFDCVVNNAEPLEAITAIQGALVDSDFRTITTNIEGIKVSADWSFRNPVNALLDPATGLLNMIGAKLVRNNNDFYLFANTAQPGIAIRYGVNMLGVKWSRTIDKLITRVIPRSGSNGEYLYIRNGGKISNGQVQNQGKIYVESAISGNYAFQRYSVLNSKYRVNQEYKNPDGTSGNYTEAEVAAKMLEEAASVFLKDGSDKPVFTLDVQFILLGDTEQYKQYKGLQTVCLYDTITVKTGKSGIDASMQVVEYEYDSLLKRYNRIRCGDVNFINQRTPGYRLIRESITMDKLAPEVIDRIYASAIPEQEEGE